MTVVTIDPWRALATLRQAASELYWQCKVDPSAPGAYVRVTHKQRKRLREALAEIPPQVTAIRLVQGTPTLVSPEPRIEELRAAIEQMSTRSIPLSDEAGVVRGADLRRVLSALARIHTPMPSEKVG